MYDPNPDLSGPWSIEFTKKDSLPGTKTEFAFLNEQSPRRPHKRGFYMCVGIALGMRVVRVVRYQVSECFVDVMLYGIIVILVDRNCRRSMRAIYMNHPVHHLRLTDEFLDLTSYVDHLLAFFCAYAYFVDHRHIIQNRACLSTGIRK